jgi:poly-gamma-glutamate synthesis protein (capsule biosynthesis protein)
MRRTLLLVSGLQQPAAPTAVPTPAEGPRDTLHLVAVGDINLGRRLAKEHLEQGDTLYPFQAVADTLRASDLLFGNLEIPIAPESHKVEGAGVVFTAPALAAEALRRVGFTIVSTANNHAWDGGKAAVEETMRRLTAAGVRFVGSGFGRAMAEQPVIVRRRGWRVAFFAVTRAWNPAPYSFYSHAGADYIAWGDTAWLYPAIRALKASGRVDLIVVSVHGGKEYVETPPAYHLSFLRGLVDAGADVVLAHHPHVLQPVEWRHGHPIFESLGNFVFFQGDPWTQLSAIVRIDVAPDHAMHVSVVPAHAGYQVTFATGAAADSVWRRLELPRPSPTSTP